MTENKKIVLYGGTYLNKGGAAIAYGTLKVFSQLGIDIGPIIDPEPQFPAEFFNMYNLSQIYRYSDSLSTKPLKSISAIHLVNPFIRCLTNSYNKEIRELNGATIWHIGDSPFSDYRSSLSIIGQVIALQSLMTAIKGKVIIGGISLEYPCTKIGELVLRHFFKSVNHFYIRGRQTYNNLIALGVPHEKLSIICDFAYHLERRNTAKSNTYSKIIIQSQKPTIALILRDYTGLGKQNYIKNLRNMISKLSSDFSIFFIPTSYAYLIPENDLIFLEKLRINQDQILNIKDFSPEEIIAIFSNFDVIVSTRLHGAVIGTLANVPTIHLYEGRKSLEVIKDLFDENTIPLIKLSTFCKDNGPNGPNGPNIIIEHIKDLIPKKDIISEKLNLRIKSARRNTIIELKNGMTGNSL